MIKKISEIIKGDILLIPNEFEFSVKKVHLSFDANTQTLMIRPAPTRKMARVSKRAERVPNAWENHVFPLTKKERREINKYLNEASAKA
jgi:virulence-associated protein VagC